MFYKKNRILFSDELQKQLDYHLDEFKRVRIIILNQKDIIDEGREYVHYYCEDYEEDEIIHFEKILNEFCSDPEIKELLKTSIKLQKDIEIYFKKFIG